MSVGYSGASTQAGAPLSPPAAPPPQGAKTEGYRSPKRSIVLGFGLRLAVTALAIGLVWRSAAGADPGAALGLIPRWIWPVPLLIMLINTGILAVRHQLCLQATGLRLPLAQIALLHLRSAFAGLILPRGGADLVRLTALARATGAPEAVVAASLLLRLIDLAVWIGMLTLFLAMGPWPGLEGLQLGVGLFVCAAVGAFGLIAVGLRAGPQLGRLPRIGPWLSPRIGRFIAAMRLGLAERALTLRVALLSLPMAVLNVLSVSLLLNHVGANLSVHRAMGLVPAMDAMLSLPVSLGGVGVREGVFVVVGGAIGVPKGAALTVAWLRWSGELGRGLLGGLSAALSRGPWLPGGDRSGSAEAPD